MLQHLGETIEASILQRLGETIEASIILQHLGETIEAFMLQHLVESVEAPPNNCGLYSYHLYSWPITMVYTAIAYIVMDPQGCRPSEGAHRQTLPRSAQTRSLTLGNRLMANAGISTFSHCSMKFCIECTCLGLPNPARRSSFGIRSAALR